MNRYDVGRVLAENSLPSVLRRAGVPVPDPGPGVRDEWRCHCPLPSHPAPADPARHKPSFVAHISGRMVGRWHCFACQAGGDAIAFVEAFAGVGFTAALGILEGRGPLPRGADPHFHIRPVTRAPGGGIAWDVAPGSDREAPRPARTSERRLYEALAVAWRYYSLDGLSALARRHLSQRAVDITALEAREGRPLAGHTPRSRTGLVDHLRRNRFNDDEAVDAGLVSRYPDGRVEDFFTHRIVLPVRAAGDRVVGLIGRDVCGGTRAKYLNTPRTAVYDKGALLYRPSSVGGRRSDNLVVVEGAIDALAVEAAAAQACVPIAAASPSGVALTATHRHQVAAWAAKPPVLCADGDAAGRAATARWVTEMTLEGTEVYAVTLPDRCDPADWLAEHMSHGLFAFARGSCADTSLGQIGPVHAGRYLAAALAQDTRDIASIRSAVARVGARLSGPGVQTRFAAEAGRGLAEAGLGPDGWLERQLVSALSVNWQRGASTNVVQPSAQGVGI